MLTENFKRWGTQSEREGSLTLATTDYKIRLSFLPLAQSDFDFLIYRRPLSDTEQSVPNTRWLPNDEHHSDQDPRVHPPRTRFAVAFEPQSGFTKYKCFSWIEPSLTSAVLFQALKRRCETDDLKGHILTRDDRFSRKVEFVIAHHAEGDQVVWLRPYGLKVTGQFGFLVDFAFRSREEKQLTSRVLELSLSLKRGRPNRDFYADRYDKLSSFLQIFGGRLSHLQLHDGSVAEITLALPSLRSTTLNQRVYEFGGHAEGPSPFQGLRKHGPLEKANPNSKLVFLFQENDRPRSQELFRGLRGDLFATFPGMEALFDAPVNNANTTGLSVADFSHSELEAAAQELKERFGSDHVVPVAVVPFSKHKSPEETVGYFAAKHAFLKHKLASQFVDRLKFDNRDSLKWSLSNIGLAIFAKMGGRPWKVKPTTTRGLIIGIGQAHRKIDNVIKRYFAYSVLTDSSGLYECVRVLGESPNESEYLSSFKENLKEILTSHKDDFDSFIVHATFTIRRSELDAIRSTLSEITREGSDEKEFAALKFNDRNDFFGYSQAVNSKVPFEGTVMRLSSHDYLVWFDGLNQQNPTVADRPERPVHVQVLFPTANAPDDTINRYLQDSLNIAGANWRGFNAKSIPISIYYAKLIADYYGRFQELGLEDIELEEITPWFL